MSDGQPIASVLLLLIVLVPAATGCGAGQVYEGIAEGVTGEPLAVEPQSVEEGELCTALETAAGQLPPLAVRVDSTYWSESDADSVSGMSDDRETLVAAVTYLNRTETQTGLPTLGGWFYAARGTGERFQAEQPREPRSRVLAPGDSLSRDVRFRLSREPYRLVVSTTGERGGDACRFDVGGQG